MRIPNCLRFAALALLAVMVLPAAEHHGQVTFNGLPLPGATVTATQGDKKVTAVTDGAGIYVFQDLADGVWQMQVEMQGFETQKREVAIAADTPPGEWQMKMLPFDQMKAGATAAPPPPPPTSATTSSAAPATPNGTSTAPATTTASAATPATTTASTAAGKSNGKSNNSKGKNGKSATPANAGTGFQRADVNASAGTTPAPASDAAPPNMGSEASSGASEAMVVNGSTSNGVERRAFGNGRRGPGSLFRGDTVFTESNSDLNAHPYSLTGLNTAQPVTNNATFGVNFGGPLWIPHVLRPSGNWFVSYTGRRNRTSSTNPQIVPTPLEREGDFSQAVNAALQPVTIYDPTNGAPFPGNVIPTSRISSQALALQQYFPQPNINLPNGYNYQVPYTTRNDSDTISGRAGRSLNSKNFVNFNGGYQKASSLNPSGPGYTFIDTGSGSGMRLHGDYRHNFTRTVWGTFNEDYSRSSNQSIPFFQNRLNVSELAGITGNDQSPLYWGPPSLGFQGSGIASLSDGTPRISKNQTNGVGFNITWAHRPHTFQFGGDWRRVQFDTISEANPRGSMAFNGQATGTTLNGVPVIGSGFDYADFLLGVPDTANLNYSNADKYFRQGQYDFGAQDDWRLTSSLSLVLGVRWEYQSPITEKYGRLVNLDVTPGFSNVAPVQASDPTGSLTRMQYPASLVQPDKHAFMPRLGIAWRPFLGSSLLVKAGYGVAYNTSVYGAIANQLAVQPAAVLPSYARVVQAVNSASSPLSLANPFQQTGGIIPTTFAIDPNFRIGYAQTWTVSVQEDIPWSMVLTTTYTGTKGTRLPQLFYPNTYPAGVNNPCPTCLTGYVYETSNGNSEYEAGRVTLHRRFHNGFTGDLTYTFSKMIDDGVLGGAGSGVGSGGGANVIAQNWLNLAAERALSPGDQRHLLSYSMQYSTGVGVHGGGLMTGWRGQIFKGWTISTSVSFGSGLPETATYSGFIPGTTFSGVRPSYTGQGQYDASGGRFLNPAAFMQPLPGTWGSVGRDTITGPDTFSINGAMARTFVNNLDLTLTSNNPINHPVFPSYYTNINSYLFGTLTAPQGMRTVQLQMRWRF